MGSSDDSYYEELAEKWLMGTITPEEEAIFNNWYNKDQDNKIVITEAFGKTEEDHKKRILNKIQKTIDQSNSNSKRLNLNTWAIAAAITFLAISGGILIYFRQIDKNTIALKEGFNKYNYAISNKAVLTLADGSKVLLADVQNGTAIKQGPIKISKSDDATLKYSASPKSGNNLNDINTLEVPLGAQYQLLLADGSKVWLNAGSSLQFPVSFTGSTRQVKLKGEGYFEVAKSTIPFEVEVNPLKVHVLGTHFNVMAYHDEAEIKTTLLEGAVRVSVSNEKQLLGPGQQAILTENKQLKLVPKADVSEAIAWKNGMFQFHNSQLDAILRQLARRYDVQIQFSGKVPTKKFTGKIPLTTELPEVLDILKYMGFNYQVQDREVLITQNSI